MAHVHDFGKTIMPNAIDIVPASNYQFDFASPLNREVRGVVTIADAVSSQLEYT